jgi:hypothetical protein
VEPEPGMGDMMVGDESEFWWIFIPSFEEGTMRRSRKWNATLETAQRGEVKHVLQQASDLPCRADYLR